MKTKKIKVQTFPVVAIGSSLGGLKAISTLLKYLPSNTGMAFIYVQHLSATHKSFLPSILSKISKMKVQEVEDMEKMEPNNIYVIPYNKGIEVTNGHIKLLPRSIKSSAITIDILFSSLAQTHKENVIGVILSGNASDGTHGLEAIKLAGGLTFAQDESAQASSMPHSAIAAGIVDFVLSPKEIARKLAQIAAVGLPQSKKELFNIPEATEDFSAQMKAVFELLLKESGVDFSHYKMTTIKRRLNHKMLQAGLKTLNEYVLLLHKNTSEIDALFKDLLINVTSFFRDAEAFRYLKTTLFPKLLKNKSADETLRIWVPACSTGEEAYSLAMIITELQDKLAKKIPVQIFATDLSEHAIREARLGEYSGVMVKAISKKYLQRFFIKKNDKYQVVKELREICVFAPHNILRDPPFSRMDFISCCNLLIYFDAAAQKKVFDTFHFALNENGFLMLGKAETIGASSSFFNRSSTKHKIYSKKKTSGARKSFELIPRFPSTNMYSKKLSTPIKSTLTNPTGIENAIDTVLLSNYMPACAVVNKEMEILQFRGPISLYLEHSSGKASLNILKMTKPEFAFELRNAIHKAIKTKLLVSKSDIEINIQGSFRLLSFEVSPLKIDYDEPLLLIVFTMQKQVEKLLRKGTDGEINSHQKDRTIKKLTEELRVARAAMNSIIEAQESTYIELQAANEEIVSTNEEFQTLNEELETSKEEIEATNEELISANNELQMRNDLLSDSYDYSEALIAAIQQPMLVLTKDLHVKSANKSFYNKFLVKKEETEGKHLFELGNKQWNIAKLRDLLNDILTKNISFESFEVSHAFPVIGEKVMLLNAHLIVQKGNAEQLVLLAAEDITERILYYKKAKDLLRKEKEVAELAVKTKQQFLSNMSHEIRTPMNAIIGFTRVVLKTELSAKQQEYIQAIKLSGDALIVLINDILDLAKVDAGKMTFEQSPFNMASAITAMLHLFETKIQDKNIELITVYDNSIPEVLVGDSVRLHQIILNLVSNAVKFTSKGKITVSVRLFNEDEKQAVIEFLVIDTGIGIAKDELDCIFENFQQATNINSSLYGGTGLGLAIVKNLVEAQGGKIQVKSIVNKGSTFSFTLPFLKSKNEYCSGEVITTAVAPIKNIKVLVVEDMPLNQLLMKTILDDFAFDRDVAENGKVAIEMLQVKSYDIVLMDLQMPVMNGFDATMYIRDTLKLTVPIIALTADVTTVDVVKCRAVGMNDYIAKPIDEKLLYSKMLSLLKLN